MTVDTVLFDLDDTLCARDQTLEEIIDGVFARVGGDPFYTPADVRAVDPTNLPAADSYREFYENSIRAVIENVGGDPSHAPGLAEATVEVIDETAVSFRPGARNALEYAREHYAVGLITNGGEDTQTEKLARLGIYDTFDTLVFATPERGVKPHTNPFERALSALDGSPERTVHVGNSLRADVAGANAMGIQSVWIPQGESPENGIEPDHTLDSLADLPALL
jgi:HAD superfamily hydrolase (TIGR01509 family)